MMAEEHVYKSDTGYATAVRRDYTDVDYCMHVIVAPTILSDSQKDKIFVKFLGSDDSNPLKFKRELEDGYVEYEGVLKAKKGDLIFYNYYVLINGSEEVKEFIYRQGDGKRKKGIWYRTIGSKDIQKKDVYHIYDGVVQGEPLDEKDKDQNILSKWISKGLKKVSKWMGNDEYQKILRIDAELAMKEFMRGLFADINNIRGEELILRFSDIVQGLRKFYYMKEKLWSSVDDFNKTIAEVLKTNLMSLINRFKESPQISDNIVNSGITTAVSIVYLKEQYDITFNTIDLSHLCKALLPNLDKAQRQSADLEDINKSYPTKIREVARYLLSMVKRLLNNSKSQCWLYCIPLLHFLQEGVYPYQDVPKATNHNDPVPMWWGIDNINSELEVYKSKSDFESPSELVQLLHPYFEMDYLLPRTFVASLSFNQFVALDTKHVPPDVMLAAFYYFVKDEKLSRNESWIYCQQEVLSKVTSQLCRLESSSITIDVLEVSRRTYRIAADVLKECFKQKTLTRVQHAKFSLCAMKTFLHSVHFFDQCLSLHKEKTKTNEHYSLLQTYENKLVDVLLTNWFLKTEDCLMLWNDAFSTEIPAGNVKDSYIDFLRTSLESRLGNTVYEYQLKTILNVFCERLDDFGNILQEILTKSALKAFEIFTDYLSLNSFAESTNARKLQQYGKLLHHIFDKEFGRNKLTDTTSVLQHALVWSPFVVFTKVYCNTNFQRVLKDKCKEHMQKSIAIMHSVCQELITGNITIQNLKNILSAESNFKSIVKEIKDLRFDFGTVEASIDLRRKQLLAFESDKAAVQHFVYICENSGGNSGVLTERLKQFEYMATVQMKDICFETKIVMFQTKCYGVHMVQQKHYEMLSSYMPTITAFGFSKEQMRELEFIIHYTKGGSFVNLLTKQGKTLETSKNRKLSVNEVLTDVWEPAKKQWQNLYTKLKKGEMLFSEFEKNYLTEDLDELHVELSQFNKTPTNLSWIDERINQFKQYKTICACSKGAKAILKLVAEYNLKGSFRQMKEIDCLARNADTTMATLDKGMLRMCTFVREINTERATCLAIFTRCKDLIMWLRESIHTMKDWNTFIELASMSSREGDLAIARVHSLHASVTGYGPLIFNYDENCDENVFLEKCNQVWRVMETDPKLPSKLLGTYKSLEWLKSVKKAHGSLEVDVLSQAETLNAKGVYKIGYIGGNTRLKKLELTDVITLSYSVQNQSRNASSAGAKKKATKPATTEVYDFKRLQSLQSLLMLVAGKAEKENIDIERFTMILDAVVRLSNVYIKLISDGCVLFAKWQATFFCDEHTPVCAFLTFGQGRDAQTLKGQTGSTDNDVGITIQKTAKFLEDCHERWLSYINEKREKFYWLNYFTIDQIVFLQQEIVRVTASQDPSVFTYPMLSDVKQNCNKENLLRALFMAKFDVQQTQIKPSIDTTKTVSGLQNESGQNRENPSFLKMITDNGYPVAVAREALKHCGDHDLEEALVWCEEHEPEFYTKPLSNESVQSEGNINDEAYRGYTGWMQYQHSMESMTKGLVHGLGMHPEESAFELLHTALKELWEKFLNSISSGVSDYLSIEHLGLILKRLAEQEIITIERSFLPFLRLGEPNLLLCNQSEIYNTVLSLYMYNQGPRNYMPLPQSDEVLLCTPDTTLDMVEVFWRRSLFAENSKIYCLVNAENLDYDIADKA